MISVHTMDNSLIFKYPIINKNSGNIHKLMNQNEHPNHLKGEMYISQIKFNEIKAWMMHTKFESIFIIVAGLVKVKCMNISEEIILNRELSLDKGSYLKVSPNTWYGFQGLSKNDSSILVLLNNLHNDNEVKKMPIQLSGWFK